MVASCSAVKWAPLGSSWGIDFNLALFYYIFDLF